MYLSFFLIMTILFVAFIYFFPFLYQVVQNKIVQYKSEQNVKKIKSILSDIEENQGI